jgi:hypothetical protein
VSPDGAALIGTIEAHKPDRDRDEYYLYTVRLDGEVIGDGRMAELEAARLLASRGVTGKLEIHDAVTGKHRLALDIAKAAKLTVREGQERGPVFAQWRKFEGLGGERAASDQWARYVGETSRHC